MNARSSTDAPFRLKLVSGVPNDRVSYTTTVPFNDPVASKPCLGEYAMDSKDEAPRVEGS